MGSYSILKNTSLQVNLPNDFVDDGWAVSENVAYHGGCNDGYIKKIFDLSSQTSWTFKYTILSIAAGGSVHIEVNNVAGVSRTLPGTYEETFSISDPATLVRFFGSGVVSLKDLQVFAPSESTEGVTFMFNEKENVWMPYYSFVTEMMVKFLNDYLTFKNGTLWVHNANEIRNNFYGVQYPSIIKFYANLNPTTVKNFYGIRVESNKPWGANANGDIFLFPHEGKPNGQVSRLKVGNFRRLQGGAYYADFLRDLNTPGPQSELVKLMKGAALQGQVMEITLTNNDTVEVRLLEVDVTTTPQKITY